MTLSEYHKTIILSGGYETKIVEKELDGKKRKVTQLKGLSSIQVLGFHKITFPQLPQFSHSHSMFLTNDNDILLCGRQQFIVEDSEWGPRYMKDFYHKMISNQECLKLENGQWVFHSTLNQSLSHCFAITMPNGVYMFGEQPYLTAQIVKGEFLENGSTKWEMGPSLDKENPSFLNCIGQFSGVRISEEEFVLIGIGNRQNNVVKYNIKQKNWEIVMKMKIPRYGHDSALIKNKIIICGGALFDPSSTSIKCPPMPKTEVIYLPSWTSKVIEHENVENGSCKCAHVSCGIMTFKNQERLVSFEKTSKVWNDDKEEWEVIEPELNISRVGFGILSVPSTMLI